jgi:hypothetical protein
MFKSCHCHHLGCNASPITSGLLQGVLSHRPCAVMRDQVAVIEVRLWRYLLT